jgi:hypothetical protein
MHHPVVGLSSPRVTRVPFRGDAGSRARSRCTPLAGALERRLCLSALFTPAPGPPLPLGYAPYLAAVGNFTGGEIADLATVNYDDKTLGVLLGTGRGGFTVAPASPVQLGNVGSAVVGDFTGNGRLDLAYGNSNDNTLSVYLGNGSGTFTLAPGSSFFELYSPLPEADAPIDIAAGDLTGNGRADLVAANLRSENLSIFLSNGDGTFTAAPGSPVRVAGNPVSLALGDFYGDGKLDIAVGVQYGLSNAVEVLRGNGNGTFSTPGPLSFFPGGSVDAIAAGDFNGDGRLDLAAADEGSNAVSVLLNKGNGKFAIASGSPIAVGSNPSVIEVGDFTGDGRQDLAVTSDSGVNVLLGNGNGMFADAPGSPFDGGFVAAGDFDGNNEPDLVVGNTGNTLSVLLNTTPAGLPTGTLAATLSSFLSAPVIAGVKNNGTATVTVSAPAGRTVKGPVRVSLYASPDLSLFDATQVTATLTQNLRLKAGASKTLRLPISLFPSAPPGTFHLIAAVEAPDGTTTAVAGPSVTIVGPVVAIHLSNVAGLPAAIAPGGKLNLGLTLQDTGNVSTAGTAGLIISLSPSPTGAGSNAAATVPLRVKLKAGQAKAYRAKFRLPRGTAAGSYYLVASLDVSALGDPTAADGVAVSAMPIIVT